MDRKLTLHIRREQSELPPPPSDEYIPAPNTRIVRTRGYGDPIMIAREGLDASLTGDNFNHVDYWASEGIKPNGVHSANWQAVTKFQRLGGAEMDFLISIQPNDYSIYGYTLDQKMNWLVGEGTVGRPYWTLGDDWSGDWDEFRFGTMVFGHSKVRIKTNPDGSPKVSKFLTEYMDYESWLIGVVEFVEVDGIRPDMLSYPLQWLIENAYVQQATEVIGKDNRINDVVRGVVYHPVWSPDHYLSNYGKIYLPRFAIIE